MKKVYKMEELDCANCAAKMERAIAKLEGVNNISVNFMSQKMVIDTVDELHDNIMKSAAKICRKIEPDCNINF